jgi:hypothetical protein
MDMDPLEQRVERAVSEEMAIAPYDPAWPQNFRREREHLLACLPLVAAFLTDDQRHLYTSAFDSPGSSRRCGGQYPVEHPAG